MLKLSFMRIPVTFMDFFAPTVATFAFKFPGMLAGGACA